MTAPPRVDELVGGAEPATTDPPGEVVATARGLRKEFSGTAVVDGIDLDLPAGQILGLIGPSGSGKTTLVRLLTGLLAPTAGEVRLLGVDPRRGRGQLHGRLGYLPQGNVLFGELSLWENLRFAAAQFGLTSADRDRLREVLELVGLEDTPKRRLADASGGMQRRLGLACALVHDPEVLFLDEPTTGVDPVLRHRFWETFRGLRDAGRTLVVTTQYVGEAAHCDQVLLLADGRPVVMGAPPDLARAAFGGHRLHVQCDRRVPGAVADRLADSEGVVSALRRPGDRAWLELVLVDDVSAPEAVQAILADEGLEVVATSHPTVDYDEVFLALVEDRRG